MGSEAGEASTPALSTENGSKAAARFLEREEEAAGIFLQVGGVESSLARAFSSSLGGNTPVPLMMMLFIGTHSVTTTLNVHSRSRSFVSAIDLRGLAPSMRLFRRPNTNGMKK